MNKLGILVSQLYKQKIRSKSFILMTLLYIAIISVVMFWTEISSLFKGEEEALQIALIKETDDNLGQIFVSNEEIEYSYHTKDVKTNMYEQVKNGTLDAVIVFTYENKNLKAEIATFSPLELND